MDEQQKQQQDMVVIFSYTREQAIADGVLVDVSQTKEAREAGFKIPIVVTAGAHALIEVPEALKGVQDYKGRLWDTLFLAAQAFLRSRGDKHLVPFKVIYQTGEGRVEILDLWLCFNEHEGFPILLPEEY